MSKERHTISEWLDCNEDDCPQCANHEGLRTYTPSQLDRIEKRQTEDCQSLDARIMQVALNARAVSEAVDRIEAKLDELLAEMKEIR
ncbi:MAG: hypothetical protein COA78_25255 [Blastopirellula sp.]|nr:MAG: hypothetical protein COA78_25255 [Blastopirellula sp.]